MIMYAAVGQLIQFCGDFLFRLLYLLGQGFPLFAFEYSLRVGLGGTNPDGTTAKALSKGYLRLFSTVLQGAFRFAVFPKKLITFNPMQYVVWRGKKEEYELFSDEDGETTSTPTLSYEQYQRLKDFLKKTAPIMRFTACRGRRNSQRVTRNYPLSALELTGHLTHRVRWGLCAATSRTR